MANVSSLAVHHMRGVEIQTERKSSASCLDIIYEELTAYTDT